MKYGILFTWRSSGYVVSSLHSRGIMMVWTGSFTYDLWVSFVYDVSDVEHMQIWPLGEISSDDCKSTGYPLWLNDHQLRICTSASKSFNVSSAKIYTWLAS